jgi:hypothetical protein
MADSGSHNGTAAVLSQLYLQLAEQYEYRSEPKMRDRFLILAADTAASAGQGPEAERLLQRLLRSSPHHMLKAFTSFAEATQAEHIRTYIDDLRKNYPLDTAENLLQSLRQDQEPPPAAATWATPLPVAPTRPGHTDSEHTLPGLLPEEPDAFNLMPMDEPDDDKTQVIPVKPVAQPRPLARPALTQPPTPYPVVKPLPATQSDSAPPRPRQPVSPKAGKPRPAGKTARRPKPKEEPGGGWLSMMLFGVVLTLGLVLVYYALLRPVFHITWLP